MRTRNWIYLKSVRALVSPEREGQLGPLLSGYRKRQWLSADELAAQQWASVTKLLRHAYESTDFYKKRFDEAGIRPEDIREPADMQHIPPLHRDALRNHLREMLSRKYQPGDLRESFTGGTTHTPTRFMRDKASVQHKLAIQTLLNTWAGFCPGDKVMSFWGAQQDMAHAPSWRWRFYERYVARQVFVQTSHVSKAELEKQRQELESFRPEIIYGYPVALEFFSRYVRESGGLKHRPRAVICTAESLDQRRSLLEETFGAKVFEHYGAREFGMIAGECEAHTGMHMHPEVAFVEYKPIAESRTEGLHELVVTDLLNQGMPLIRYVSDDCAVPRAGKCPCGRNLQMIAEFGGRRNTMFKLPDGSSLLGTFLPGSIQERFAKITKVQMIQHTLQDFDLRYVSDSELDPAESERLINFLAEYFKLKLNWKLLRENDIPREASGKMRACISHVIDSRANHLASH
jgi:phenylacetate-CoA ligase